MLRLFIEPIFMYQIYQMIGVRTYR